MSGTSRSIQRALASVFESWDSAHDWETEPSVEISNLYDNIYKYTERHNTLSTLNSTVNDELRATHVTHVSNSGDIRREVFFLELLSRLSPTLSKDHVNLWLKTYLRPAVDSAGFDLSFVNRARNFIRSLTLELVPTPDPALFSRRIVIADMVMGHILQIFIGGSTEAYALIGLEVSEAECDTQTHCERVRFIENNCAILLTEWALKNPIQFFTLLHKWYNDSHKRFKIVAMAAKVVSHSSSQIQQILETRFFLDILRSLLLDTSEAIVGSCLSILSMAMGKICHKIHTYVPELLTIYARLLLWKEYGAKMITDHKTLKEHNVAWETAKSDQNTSIMQTFQICEDGNINISFYTTLLYGLFPANLLAFCKSPNEYLKNSPPKHLLVETTMARECFSTMDDVRKSLSIKSNRSLSRLLLHPNILQNVSPSEELEKPLKWILQKNEGSDIGEEEVLLECYGMNPDILFSIPDDVVLPEQVLKKIQSTNSFSSNGSDLKVLSSIQNTRLLNEDMLSFSKRGSLHSFAEPVITRGLSLDSNLPAHWLNLDRRVSIVPTRLVLDSQTAAPVQSPAIAIGQAQLQSDQGIVKFRTVDFNGSSDNSESTVHDEKNADSKKRDHLSELYTVHEKLYSSPVTVATGTQTAVNAEPVQSATVEFQGSEKSASDALTKIQTDGKGESKTAKDQNLPSAGTALDFYQRELLLMKNELEFSSYMKHLNKISYLKLKLRFNKMIRDQNMDSHMARENETRMAANTPQDITLADAMENLQVTAAEAIASKNLEIENLYEKLKSMREETNHIRMASKEAQAEMDAKVHRFQTLVTDTEALRAEICDMQRKIDYLEKEQPEPLAKSPPGNGITEEVKEPPARVFLSDTEKALVDLETRLEITKAQNSQYMQQLEIAQSALESEKSKTSALIEHETAKIREMLRTQKEHYESRIKELLAVQSKYQQALDRQNVKSEPEIQQRAHADSAIKIKTKTGIKTDTETETAPRLAVSPPFATTALPAGETLPRHTSIDPLLSPPIFDGDYFRSTHSSPRRGSSPASRSSVSSAATTSRIPNSAAYQKPSRVNSSATIPNIKGRGGFQKRPKKIM